MSNTPRPPQEQDRQPGVQSEMTPHPEIVAPGVKGSGLLTDRVAIVTGGDSGIGQATAVAFAREGADVVVSYLDEHSDAEVTKGLVEERGRKCLLIPGDIGEKAHCREIVDRTLGEFGRLDILVNNAAEQHPQDDLLDISEEQLTKTFRTNIFSMFFLTKAALPHLRKAESPTIINCTSVTSYEGHPMLVDYSSTKGAITAFTRALAAQLAEENIRVNGVAPGPIWTPLIPATFPAEQVASFGEGVPLGRAGHPWECAECFVFLASPQSNYITGQVLHPNGGRPVAG